MLFMPLPLGTIGMMFSGFLSVREVFGQPEFSWKELAEILTYWYILTTFKTKRILQKLNGVASKFGDTVP